MENPEEEVVEQQTFDLDQIIYKEYEEIELKGSYFEETLIKNFNLVING